MKIIEILLLLFLVQTPSAFAGCKELLNSFIKEAKSAQKNRPGKIPAHWYKDYPSETIGELIAKRIHLNNESNVESLNIKDGFNYRSKSVKIALAIRDQELSKVLSDGVFLNMHQTGRTNGESTLSQRVSKEHELANLEFSDERWDNKSEEFLNKIKELRPKSAYLFLGNLKNGIGLGKTNVRMQYGDVFAVFKNHIKDRALLTQHDSLASSRAYSFDIKPETPLPATQDMMGDYSAYFEALIFGRLGLDDVDYWLYDVSDMPRSELRELIDSEGSTLHRLLKSGVKIYKAKYVDYNGRQEVVKGTQIKL